MARPPRIPVLLPLETEVTYFVTLCVEHRRTVLNNEEVWVAIQWAIKRTARWYCLAAVAMPDHLHLLISPLDREETVCSFSKYFKRTLRMNLQAQWRWQPGCFDRLLRSNESVSEKWMYMRENPVRANLVHRWNDWSYQFGFSEV